MSSTNLTKDHLGNYQRRNLGVLFSNDSGSPVSFDLGKNKRNAINRALNLERAWQSVSNRWTAHKSTSEPCWDETTLQIANTLAMGRDELALELPDWWIQIFERLGWGEALCEVLVWLSQLQISFPMITLTLRDQEIKGLAEDTALAVLETLEEEATRIDGELTHFNSILGRDTQPKPYVNGVCISHKGREHVLKVQSNSVIIPILQEFQRLDWPRTAIQLPPDLEGDIKQAIYRFNNKQNLIRLHESAGGIQIHWSKTK